MTKDIEERIEARKLVNGLVELAENEMKSRSDNFQQAVKDAAIEKFKPLLLGTGHVILTQDALKERGYMTSDEVKAYEEEEIGFGKFIGKKVKDIPLSYLVWLLDNNKFVLKLDKYIKSNKVQSELEELEDDDDQGGNDMSDLFS